MRQEYDKKRIILAVAIVLVAGLGIGVHASAIPAFHQDSSARQVQQDNPAPDNVTSQQWVYPGGGGSGDWHFW